MPVVINGTTGITNPDGTAAAPALTGTDTNTGIFFPAADTIAFAEGGVEAMRIDSSGNVGIGMSSPGVKLDVSAAGSGGVVGLRIANTDTTASSPVTMFFQSSDDGTLRNRAGINSGDDGSNNGFLSFSTRLSGSVAERMRITSAGNVGIGTNSPQAKVTINQSMNVYGGSAYAPSSATGQGLNFGNDGGGTEQSWIQALRNNTSETRSLLINPLGGNVLVGTSTNTSGGGCLQISNGITFPATEVASANANTLDDYEEGTWTPSLGGNTTYLRQQGSYTKVGRIVCITGRIDVTTLGTGSNSTISGLPFTSKASFQEQGLSVGFFGDLAVNTTFLAPRVINNTTTINAVGIASSGTTMSALNIFGNSAVLIFTGCYEVA